MQQNIKIFITSCFVVLGFTIHAGDALSTTTFEEWIESFYQEARKEGITRDTYNAAFKDVVELDRRVTKKANYQPEFKTQIWDYLDARVNSMSVKKGQRMARYYSRTLDAVEKQFQVSRYILLAIWSMESNYGEVLKKKSRLHYVPQALATLAYKDEKRQKFAKKQLIALLKILQAGYIDRDSMTGSWAGAMGHTQFIPTSYLAYGVDMDGDGRRDIWNSIPDALATAANLLHKNGWKPRKTWGYEAVLPDKSASFEALEGKTKTLREWQEMGVVRMGGGGFPRPGDKAVLKLPAGIDGPVFLMLKNFYVLKRYNNADAYALAVGVLADRIAGYKDIKGDWPRPAGSLSFDEKIELQGLLKTKGYYDGKIDGYLGSGSRSAIKAFEKASGLAETGQPTKNLLKKLR